ncbi:hypothetical protein J008_06843 [Cryptococcus neoformans]|nr:hypothetical protein J008_06843 [Cryptococcus neoformans var. grubii]
MDRRGATRPTYQPPHLRRPQVPSGDASKQGGWPSAHGNPSASGPAPDAGAGVNSTYGGWSPSTSTNTPRISGARNTKLPTQAQVPFPKYASRPGEGDGRLPRARAGLLAPGVSGLSVPVGPSSEQDRSRPSMSRGPESIPGPSLPPSQSTSRSAAFAIRAPSTSQILHDRYTPRSSRRDWSAPSLSGPFISSSSTMTSVPASGRTLLQERDRSALESSAGDIKPMRPRKEEKWAGNDIEREMELMQSISRSGGDGAEGDALKNWETQEKYRQYIAEKVESHYRKYDTPLHTPPILPGGPAIGKDERKENGKGKEFARAREELESLDSLVLLFRKLREGVVASGRIDSFAIEVFESSARFAILSNNRPQLLSALSGLVPGLYKAYDATKIRPGKDSLSDRISKLHLEDRGLSDNRVEFTSLLLLYHLVTSGRVAFNELWLELTAPVKRQLRGKFEKNERVTPQEDASFLRMEELSFAKVSSTVLSSNSFNPLIFFSLVSPASNAWSNSTSPYEKIILSWAIPQVREEGWKRLAKCYMSVGIPWIASILGKSARNQEETAVIENWVQMKGKKVEHGRVSLSG